MPELVRLHGLTAKVEGTYKTDATPAVGTDGVQVEALLHDNLSTGFLEENLREELAHEGLGRAGATVPTGRFAELEVTTALKGRSSAFSSSNKPEMSALLRACGLNETVDTTGGSETVTYEPRSSGFESATVYAYSADKLYKLLGVMGSVRFVFTPGQFPVAVFSLQGVLSSDPSQTTLPTITYPAKGVTPPTVKGAGLTLNSVDPSGFDDFELNAQVNVVERPHGNDSDGHAGYYVSDWNPQITVTIEQPAISTLDPWTLRKDGTLFAWDIGPVGATQYNRVKLSGPKGRITDVGGSASDGIAMRDLTIRCQNTDEENPDDAFSLVFS